MKDAIDEIQVIQDILAEEDAEANAAKEAEKAKQEAAKIAAKEAREVATLMETNMVTKSLQTMNLEGANNTSCSSCDYSFDRESIEFCDLDDDVFFDEKIELEKSNTSPLKTMFKNMFIDLNRTQAKKQPANNIKFNQLNEIMDPPSYMNVSLAKIDNDKDAVNLADDLDKLYLNVKMEKPLKMSAEPVQSTPKRQPIKAKRPSSSKGIPRSSKNQAVQNTPSVKRFYPTISSSSSPKTQYSSQDKAAKKIKH